MPRRRAGRAVPRTGRSRAPPSSAASASLVPLRQLGVDPLDRVASSCDSGSAAAVRRSRARSTSASRGPPERAGQPAQLLRAAGRPSPCRPADRTCAGRCAAAGSPRASGAPACPVLGSGAPGRGRTRECVRTVRRTANVTTSPAAGERPGFAGAGAVGGGGRARAERAHHLRGELAGHRTRRARSTPPTASSSSPVSSAAPRSTSISRNSGNDVLAVQDRHRVVGDLGQGLVVLVRAARTVDRSVRSVATGTSSRAADPRCDERDQLARDPILGAVGGQISSRTPVVPVGSFRCHGGRTRPCGTAA